MLRPIISSHTSEFVSPTAMNSPVKFSTKMSWGSSEKSFRLKQTTKKKNPTEPQQNQTKSKTAKEKQKKGAEKYFVLMRSCALLARELSVESLYK